MFGTAVNRPVTQSLLKLITGEKAIDHLADLTVSTLIHAFWLPSKSRRDAGHTISSLLIVMAHHMCLTHVA